MGDRAGEVAFERGSPTCPAFLSREAKAEWKRQIKQLESQGILQLVDRAILTAYCQAWGEFANACAEIEARLKEGKPLDAMARLVRLKNAAAAELIRLAGHFGFSPATRVRIKSPEKKEQTTGGKARFFAG